MFLSLISSIGAPAVAYFTNFNPIFLQYGAYIGCFDGALEELDRVLRLCEKYGIGALLDIHAMRGSQNGLDNSGTTGNMEWTYTASDGGYTKYLHWDIRGTALYPCTQFFTVQSAVAILILCMFEC